MCNEKEERNTATWLNIVKQLSRSLGFKSTSNLCSI